MAHEHAQDDGFHEIQLNGKQLVFLFMAATVVSVVIFLCGVLVGRGVRSERSAGAADAVPAAPATTPDIVVAKEPVAQTPVGSDPTTAPPPPAVGELSYFNRLEKRGQPAENLKAASEKPVVAGPIPAPAEKPAKRDAPPPRPEAPAPAPRIATPPPAQAPKEVASKPAVEPRPQAAAAGTEPAGSGFALQVTALRERAEADAIVKRLSAKGYSAYVLNPANGAASVYRVRVGKFKTRREAEAIATRLQKEERFKPWITR